MPSSSSVQTSFVCQRCSQLPHWTESPLRAHSLAQPRGDQEEEANSGGSHLLNLAWMVSIQSAIA